jgi:hypothetical protein
MLELLYVEIFVSPGVPVIIAKYGPVVWMEHAMEATKDEQAFQQASDSVSQVSTDGAFFKGATQGTAFILLLALLQQRSQEGSV